MSVEHLTRTVCVTVYVDELRKWPTAIRCFRNGSAHLTADTEEELHAVAERIGLRRSWFQDKGATPHYDLTPSKRSAALLAGAVFVPGREQARLRIAARRAFEAALCARCGEPRRLHHTGTQCSGVFVEKEQA